MLVLTYPQLNSEKYKNTTSSIDIYVYIYIEPNANSFNDISSTMVSFNNLAERKNFR